MSTDARLSPGADPAAPLRAELDAQLDALAASPVLLVASDFDGTLAPIVADPARAEAEREALVALRNLSRMPQTHVAIVSGRALADLAARAPDSEEIHLVGSHGSEFEPGFTTALSAPAASLLDRLKAWLRPLAPAGSGFILEEKPASVAFHYRSADAPAAAAAVDRVLAGPARWEGVHVRHGKMVIELSVVATDKGQALQRLRQRLGATAVLFLGDDVTDEDAFRQLSGPDVGVKVGPGASAARWQVDGPLDVARLLARVAEQRAAWLMGAAAVPIEDHALLSDQRTIALVSPQARVVWMCVPRIDSGAVFAELLGGPTAGFFAVEPVPSAGRASQSYVGDAFVLRTAWPNLVVTDYLDCAGGRAFQRAGRTDLVRVLEGHGRVRVTFSPRLDFGRMETGLAASEHGVELVGALDPCALYAPNLPWQVRDDGRHQTAVAEFELGPTPVVLELRWGTANLLPTGMPEPERRRRVEQFWSGWARTLSLPRVATDLVRRSALVLKALCYGPSGAIVAAATTSLPEHAGGVRNWDYRFCWPRDAALSASALVRLGATGPALKYLDWVLGIVENCEPGSMISPVYTVTGGHLGSEGEIAELAGYRGSRPVRVGNAAAQQVQLDVFGPIAELLALLAERGAALSSEHWRLVERMVAAVERRWMLPDHGIWEVRRPRQHHVHSKVMCWQTVDRSLRVAAYLGQRRPAWTELAGQIAADILARGWNREVGAFCATYDDQEADAAALCVGLSGLLPPTEERVTATIDFVQRGLQAGPTLYRYRYDDGLPGIEGGFLLCSAWLIEACAAAGRVEQARRLLDDYVALAGPTGLFAEEYDPAARIALGNFPQAYSHLGLINAALALEAAEARGGA